MFRLWLNIAEVSLEIEGIVKINVAKIFIVLSHEICGKEVFADSNRLNGERASL